jgi:hypothetical protein
MKMILFLMELIWYLKSNHVKLISLQGETDVTETAYRTYIIDLESIISFNPRATPFIFWPPGLLRISIV